MFFVTWRTILAIRVELISKLGTRHRTDQLHIRRPFVRPADVADERTGLAEWKIQRGDPGTGTRQNRFECPEVMPSFELQHAQIVFFRRALTLVIAFLVPGLLVKSMPMTFIACFVCASMGDPI